MSATGASGRAFAQYADLMDQALKWRAERDEAIAERDAATREVELLRALLSEAATFADHYSWRCAHPPHYHLVTPPENDCACGLDSFYRRIEEALRAASPKREGGPES